MQIVSRAYFVYIDIGPTIGRAYCCDQRGNCRREEVEGLAKSRPALTEVPPVFLYHCSHILSHF